MEEKILKPVQSSQPVVQHTPVNDPIPTTETVPADVDGAESEGPVRVTEQDYRTSPLFYQVADYFGVESQDYETAKNKLSAIVDWAAENAGSSNTEDILLKLRETEEKVARLDPFEKRYKMMFRYVMLKGKEQSIQKALKAFEKGGV